MLGFAGRIALLLAVAVFAANSIAACADDTQTTTVTAQEAKATARLKAFAFSETEHQAKRTCESVPRKALAVAFAERSSGVIRGDPRHYDDNAIALLFVEDIDISPIRLQTAAYNGCLDGLAD